MSIYDFWLPILHALMFLPCALMLAVMALALLGSINAKRSQQESLRILGGFRCPNCHEVFGADSAAQAAKEQAERFGAHCREHPGIRFRIAPVWPITCARCGYISRFNYRTNELSDSAA